MVKLYHDLYLSLSLFYHCIWLSIKKITGSIWHKLAHTRVEKQYLKDTLLYITQKYDVPIPYYMQNNANHRRYRNLTDKP